MKPWFLAFLLTAVAAPADAAIVFLKDGSRLQGTVVSASATDIRLFTGAQTLDIDPARVLRIDYSDAAPPPPPQPPSQFSAPPRERIYRPRREPWEAAPARQMLSLDLGLGAPTTETSIGAPGGETTSNGDVGPLVGAEYLYEVAPRLALGADFEYLYRSPTATPNLFPGTVANVSGNTEMMLAVAKFSLTDRGYARPYFLAGLGVDNTSTNIDATPRWGNTWADTGTTETRDLVDGNSWGVASTLRFGVDFNVYDPVVFSVEAGWTGLNNAGIPATGAGQALGLTGTSGPLDFFTVAGRWGWRF